MTFHLTLVLVVTQRTSGAKEEEDALLPELKLSMCDAAKLPPEIAVID